MNAKNVIIDMFLLFYNQVLHHIWEEQNIWNALNVVKNHGKERSYQKKDND